MKSASESCTGYVLDRVLLETWLADGLANALFHAHSDAFLDTRTLVAYARSNKKLRWPTHSILETTTVAALNTHTGTSRYSPADGSSSSQPQTRHDKMQRKKLSFPLCLQHKDSIPQLSHRRNFDGIFGFGRSSRLGTHQGFRIHRSTGQGSLQNQRQSQGW